MRVRGFIPAVSHLIYGFVIITSVTQLGLTLPAQEEQPAQVRSRVVEHVDDARRVTLTGNTIPMARPQFDRGRVDSGKMLEKIIMVLKRSPEQEAALAAFNEQQYDPKSPHFHHWLHAEEFGQLYGPSDSDITQVTSWLQNHGFQINQVSKGRTFVQFTGSVAQVEDAFHLEMHNYMVNGKMHLANDRDPQIPEALAPVVTGLLSLHNFFPVHQSWFGSQVNRDPATGKITLAHPEQDRAALLAAQKSNAGNRASNVTNGSPLVMSPQFTFTDSNDDIREDLTAADFGVIYNIDPLWTASTPINGSGVTVSISGVSDITKNDITVYRSAFGLPATTVDYIQSDPSTDPGISSPGENTEDLEMVSAAAPGASLQMVISGATATTFGDYLSDAYIIDNETAPIMSASYGFCELELGTGGNAAYNSIWQQGATEGISIFESAGDQGAAGCEDQNGASPNATPYGLQVNGMASSPYVVAVGGTDLLWAYIEDTTPASTYWNATNGTDGVTAKGYMPEIVWNSTCANPVLMLQIFPEQTSSEELCNNAAISLDYQGIVDISAGSGGVSACTTNGSVTLTPTSNVNLDPTTCSGGYAKPSYQTALTPADGHRDLPDISMFASYGWGYGTRTIGDIPGSAILVCVTQNGSTCTPTGFTENGGTSAASPFSAGVMAMILQKNGGLRQGLPNPVFYKMAAAESFSTCNSSTVTAGNSCYFYDITQGSNAQVCQAGTPNCTVNTTGDTYGILSGYDATTGYDLATGLGSMNVENVVNGWAAIAGAPAVKLSSTSLTFTSSAVGTTSTAQTITVQNTGTATLYITSIALGGTNATSFAASEAQSGGCSSSSVAAGASCTISVTFDPVATGSSSATLTITDSAGTGSHAITLSGSISTSTAPVVKLSTTSIAFPTTAVGSTSGSSSLTVQNTGTAALTGISVSLTGTDPSSFLIASNGCGTSLAISAVCTISVAFKPASTGSLSATLSIADNASGSPQTVSLSGTGGTSSQTPAAITSPSSGTIFPGPNVTFTWGAATGATAYELYIGNTGAGSNNLYNSGNKTVTTLAVSGLPTAGGTINVRLITSFGGTLLSNDYTYTAATRGALTSPAPGSTLTGPNITFTWSAATGGPISGYRLYLGSTGVGSNNLYNSGVVTGTSFATLALPTNGETIYARLITSFNGTLAFTDYTYTAVTHAELTSPAPGGLLPGKTVTFTWSAAVGGTYYELWLGSTGPGSYNLYDSLRQTVKTITVGGLPDNGETIYARVLTDFNGSWSYADYTYTAVTAPVMSSPAQGGLLPGPTVNFIWSGAVGESAYELYVGSTGAGSNNVYSSGSKTASSLEVSSLPTNGETLYVRLLTNFNGSWAYSDYTYTAATHAVLATPAAGSTFSSANPTITITPATGTEATAYELYLGSTGVGSSDLYSSGQSTATSFSPKNLPTNGETIYARVLTNFGGTWGYADYTFKAQ